MNYINMLADVMWLKVTKSGVDVDQIALDVNQMKLMQLATLVNLYQDLGGGYRFTESQPLSTLVGK